MRLIEHYAGFIVAYEDGTAEYFVKTILTPAKLAFEGIMLAPYHNFDIFYVYPPSRYPNYFVPQLHAWFITAPTARAAITRHLNKINNHGRN